MSAYLLVLLVISAGLAPAGMATKRREGQSAWDLLQCADPDPNRPNNRICDRCGSSVSKSIFYKNGHSDFTCPPRTLTTTGSGAQGGAEHHDGASGSAPRPAYRCPQLGCLMWTWMFCCSLGTTTGPHNSYSGRCKREMQQQPQQETHQQPQHQSPWLQTGDAMEDALDWLHACAHMEEAGTISSESEEEVRAVPFGSLLKLVCNLEWVPSRRLWACLFAARPSPGPNVTRSVKRNQLG